MTNEVSEYVGTGVNLYGSAIATSAQEALEGATFRDVTSWFYHTETDFNGNRVRVGVDPALVRITQIRITDLRNGWGQSDDRLMTATSTAYQAQRRHMLLPPKVTQATLASAGPGNGCLFHCWFGTEKKLLMGGGTETNFALFTETSSVDPTPAAVTYDPVGCNVVSISAGVLNNTDERPIVGHDTNVVARYFDANLAASTAMHANSADLWGSARTNINATTPGLGGNILYAGGNGGASTANIYYLAENAAVAGAPTATLTGIPAGGAVLGVEALQKNWLNRIYMWWPLSNQASSGIQLGVPGQMVSLNLEGTGPELVPTTLSRCYFGFFSNKTLVQSDGVRMVAFDGETERDLHILKGRESNSNFRWGVSGGFDHEGSIYAYVVRFDLTVGAGTVGASVLTLERFFPESDTWVPVTGTWGTGSASGATEREMIYGRVDFLHNVGMSMPWSKQTGFAHLNMRNSNKWDRTWLAPEGVNPFLHYNKTGSGNEGAQEWAAQAVWTSDKFPITPYHGFPSVWLGCSAAEMDIAAGGTGSGGTPAKVTMEGAVQDGTTHTFTGAQSEVFDATEPIDTLTRWWGDNTDAWTLGRVRITIDQDSTTAFKTPNALPAVFYSMTFLNGVVQSPTDMGFIAPGEQAA